MENLNIRIIKVFNLVFFYKCLAVFSNIISKKLSLCNKLKFSNS